MTEQKANTFTGTKSSLRRVVTTPEEEKWSVLTVVGRPQPWWLMMCIMEIVEDYRDGFNIESVKQRYNDIWALWLHRWRLGPQRDYVWKVSSNIHINWARTAISIIYKNIYWNIVILDANSYWKGPEAQHKPGLLEEKPRQRPRRTQ